MIRWPALSGAMFVALFIVAAAAYGNGAGRDDAAITAYFADAGQRRHQEIGFAVLTAGCVCLLIFVAVLAAELSEDPLPRLVLLASGTANAVLLLVANGLWAATAFAVEIDGPAAVSTSGHLLLEDAAFILVVTSAAAAIPMVIVATRVGVQRVVLPRWTTALGTLAAFGLAGAYWYLPLAAYLLWLAAVSVILFRHQQTAPTNTRTAEPDRGIPPNRGSRS